MIKAISVIFVMLIINVFMVFAIFKVAARLDDSLRRFFVVKIGGSEYSKIRVNKNFGTFVGADPIPGDGDGEGGEGEGEGEGEAIPEEGNNMETVQSSFLEDELRREIQQQMAYESLPTIDGSAPSNVNLYNSVDVENETEKTQTEYETINSVPAAEDISVARYKNNDLVTDYKIIKQLSSLDRVGAVEAVKSAQIQEGQDYGNYVLEVNEMLDYDTAFKLSALDNDDQEDILRQIFTPQQQEVLDDYIAQNPGRLNAIDFYGYLQNLTDLCDTHYYIYTGNEGEVYSGLGDDVTSVYDDAIAEGIKVVYKNKLYDYSI